MIQKAHIAYNEKDYERAFKLYSELAETGDMDGETSLGFMYQNGQGCEIDEAKAIELYERASKKNQPLALFNLANIHKDGDQFKAYEFMLKSAIAEVPQAMYEVGLMLERGLGCEANFSESAFWYEEGAKRGDLQAFNNLGVLYKEGHGVEQNDAKCFICFSRASEGNLSQGHYNLGLLYDQGIGCDEDHDKALDLCRKASYLGHKKAKKIISELQEDGKIIF